MASLPDRETDREFLARLDWMDATLRAQLEADYPVADHGRESHYEPTTADLAEMARWSQSVEEHDEALQTWMDFFGDEERSTFYVE